MRHHRTVDSSNVHELEFDDATNELVVTFKGGALYRYEGVPKRVFDELIASESIGRYLAAYIKNDYPATRLRAGSRGEKS